MPGNVKVAAAVVGGTTLSFGTVFWGLYVWRCWVTHKSCILIEFLVPAVVILFFLRRLGVLI